MKLYAKLIVCLLFAAVLFAFSYKTSKAPNAPMVYSSTIGTFPEGKVYLFTYENAKYIVFSNGSSISAVRQ